jgi:hypothetical protein
MVEPSEAINCILISPSSAEPDTALIPFYLLGRILRRQDWFGKSVRRLSTGVPPVRDNSAIPDTAIKNAMEK